MYKNDQVRSAKLRSDGNFFLLNFLVFCNAVI